MLHNLKNLTNLKLIDLERKAFAYKLLCSYVSLIRFASSFFRCCRVPLHPGLDGLFCSFYYRLGGKPLCLNPTETKILFKNLIGFANL